MKRPAYIVVEYDGLLRQIPIGHGDVLRHGGVPVAYYLTPATLAAIEWAETGRSRIAELEALNRELEVRLAATGAELARGRVQMVSAADELAAVEARALTIMDELAGLRRRCEELEASEARLRERLRRSEETHHRTARALVAANAALRQLRPQFYSMVTEIRRLRQVVECLRQAVNLLFEKLGG
jgi:chromosome segregation ATPase